MIITNDCTPELITLTWNGSAFTVVGTVTGVQPDCAPDAPYEVSGITFTVNTGSTPFAVGDTFLIEIKTPVYEPAKLYVKLDGAYRTLSSPGAILFESASTNVVAVDPETSAGTWELPPQLTNNVQNETRAEIGQGDLYYHFISMMSAQQEFIGSEAGQNNWRNIPHNLGLGGKIKQYDDDILLLVGALLQEKVTIPALLDFARESYEALFTKVRNFVEEVVPTMLNGCEFTPPTSGDSLDALVVSKFKEYFAGESALVAGTPTLADDQASTIFYDTTSPLSGMVVTLPYLGLAPVATVEKVLDLELNLAMLRHHDGHYSQLSTVSDSVLKKIVTKLFVRSPGQSTAGHVTGVTAPPLPYKGQFWYQTSTGKLYFYNVVSDNDPTAAVSEGQYAYDRDTNVLYQYSSGTLNNLGSSTSTIALPWTEVKLDLIEQNLLLAIETELAAKCPTITPVLPTTFSTDSHYDAYLEKELVRFGIKYRVPSIYGGTYDPDNAFTWNYRNAFVGNENLATWQKVYEHFYGTVRPDLQPWVPAGYADEAALIADLITNLLIPNTTTEWSLSFWQDIAVSDFIRAAYILNGAPSVLAVDLTTSGLLPPYSTNVEALTGVMPPGKAEPFAFKENGPIELFWRKSLNFLYSEQKVFYKINPLAYVHDTWRLSETKIGDYTFSDYFGRKLAPKDVLFHGELLPVRAKASWLTATVDTAPTGILKYVLTYQSQLANRYEVKTYINSVLQSTTHFVGNVFTDANCTLTFAAPQRLTIGDKYTVTVQPTSVVTVEVAPQTKNMVEGFNQLFVQYNRAYGEDLSIALGNSLFKNWSVKLGYRAAGLINTDSTVVRFDDLTTVDPSYYSTYIKENRFYNSSWANALRVQLVKIGSSERVGGYHIPATKTSPGEDWVFRVDTYNTNRPELSWHTFGAGESTTFVALDGKRTLYEWTRPSVVTGTVTRPAPFLVTGLQNFINFAFGYASKLEADGWRFNDQEDPALDPDTGRPISFQLLIEKFIVQQFSNPPVGSAFIFNPFAQRVWYKTPHGAVSNLGSLLGIEQETVAAVLDQDQRQLTPKDLRVFRQDDLTEIVFDRPAYTVHLLTSEFEHVILVESYSGSNLIYDQFLGQRVSRLLLSTERQRTFTGRLDFGGHFLLGDEMKRNIESSVSSILDLYSSSDRAPTPSPQIERARALVGFNKSGYFDARGSSDPVEFRFWRGLIKNKGTNFSVSAFINSAKYKTAAIDELWAYRLATYGEARTLIRGDLRVEKDDSPGDVCGYRFLEVGESPVDADADRGYDIGEYDLKLFDNEFSTIIEVAPMPENRGIPISPTDEARWNTYSDLKSIDYLRSDVVGTMTVTVSNIEQIVHVIDDVTGKEVRADCFVIEDINELELVGGTNTYDSLPYDTDLIDADHLHGIFYENGNYIDGSDPVAFTTPKFRRLNSCVIQLLDPTLADTPLRIIGYGPAHKRYSPIELYNYVDRVRVKDDVIFWDPARGVHHPRAHAQIDYEQPHDPARYLTSLFTKSETSSKLAPWSKGEVGKLWWNTANARWRYYHDTKNFPQLMQRMGAWGGLVDDGSIDVYEWVKSDVHPQSYADGGEPLKHNLTRDRTWSQRIIGWRHSDDPGHVARTFLVYQPVTLKVHNVLGKSTVTLSSGTFDGLGLSKGTKLSGINYSSPDRTDDDVVDGFGLAVITGNFATYKVGSAGETAAAYNNGATFVASSYVTDLAFTVEQGSSKTDLTGAYALSTELDTATSINYVRLTHVPTGNTQRLAVRDTAPTAGHQEVYSFDELNARLSFNNAFGWTDNWTSLGTSTTALQRQGAIAAALGAAHNIFVRSEIEVFNRIKFGSSATVIINSAVDTLKGWVAWNDPTTNPAKGPAIPFNKYEPVILSEWTPVGSILVSLADDIKARTKDLWTFDGNSYAPYLSTWSDWRVVEPEVREARYSVTSTVSDAAFMANHFTFNLNKADLKARVNVFVDGQRTKKYTVTNSSVVKVPDLTLGQLVRVTVDPYAPTSTELAFDPAKSDTDPLIVKQYKVDWPHSEVRDRDGSDGLVKTYYFWVKGKQTLGKGKKMSAFQVQALLSRHDDMFAVPQILKHYDQVNDRPIGYATLMVFRLGLYVQARNRYLLKIIYNPSLRNDEEHLSRKNYHEEWTLISKQQSSRIPKALWDALTDTLAGETSIGEALPFSTLESYDGRNGTSVRYGFGPGQVLTDPGLAKAALKYTILNTSVNKYEGGQLVPDYISYAGFDIDALDTYLSTASNVRKFMSDLWRFASPRQVNEIFFQALEEATAKNLEIDGLFKTSIIALNDIRTIDA